MFVLKLSGIQSKLKLFIKDYNIDMHISNRKNIYKLFLKENDNLLSIEYAQIFFKNISSSTSHKKTPVLRLYLFPSLRLYGN